MFFFPFYFDSFLFGYFFLVHLDLFALFVIPQNFYT